MNQYKIDSAFRGLMTIALAWSPFNLLLAAEPSEDATAKDAAFKPIVEAELPNGFPTYTPVGKIEVKQYPAARMVRAKSSGDSAFWKLFMHIKSHNVAMSAPVQMEYRKDEKGETHRATMAFFYGDRKVGKIGPDGSVEVVDVPESKAVSIGLRGTDSRTRISSAREKLEGWLKEHPEYQASGELRLMGYNSPFIPADKQFFEVQLPVKEVKK